MLCIFHLLSCFFVSLSSTASSIYKAVSMFVLVLTTVFCSHWDRHPKATFLGADTHIINVTKNCHFPLQCVKTGHASFSPPFHTINLILLFSEWFLQNPCYHRCLSQLLFLCTHLCVKEQTVRRAINYVLAPYFPDMFLLEQELPFSVVISPNVVPVTHQTYLRALSLYVAPLVLFHVSD